jgi:parvulin-like peptidyl-prolyl isomerase
VKTTELVARGSTLPDIGVSPDIDKAAFALPEGGISDPVATPQGTAIVRVAGKEGVTDQQIAAGMDLLRDELVNQRRDRLFGGYMSKAKENLKIQVHPEAVARAMEPARR